VTAEIRWRADAIRDVREIQEYIARDNIVAAQNLADAIFNAAHRLARFPEAGSPRSDFFEGARQLVVGKYLILYLGDRDRVHIVRVVHGARDLARFTTDLEGLV
jgi:toxin ParE1/3/4